MFVWKFCEKKWSESANDWLKIFQKNIFNFVYKLCTEKVQIWLFFVKISIF